jgi:striatin 1/3/4
MNGGGANGGGDGNAPAGTEYTLQGRMHSSGEWQIAGKIPEANTVLGVMRFLQLEWHNHERARNAWDIERAEMKAKIAKQEGEVRSAKKLNDQLNKHIRMLEQALTNERKKKAEATGEAAADDKKESKGKKSGLKPAKRAYIAGKPFSGDILTLSYSREQEAQLLSRRRFGIPRPLRSRTR